MCIRNLKSFHVNISLLVCRFVDWYVYLPMVTTMSGNITLRDSYFGFADQYKKINYVMITTVIRKMYSSFRITVVIYMICDFLILFYTIAILEQFAELC